MAVLTHQNVHHQDPRDKYSVAKIPLMRPVLTRRNANKCPANTKGFMGDNFTTNYCFIRKRANHSFRFYSNLLIDGFMDPVKIRDISNLCAVYLYDNNDEIHELAFVIYKLLIKSRKKSISKKLLSKLVQHWFKIEEDDIDEVNEYVNQLLAAEYIVHCPVSPNPFRISVISELGFGKLRSYRNRRT